MKTICTIITVVLSVISVTATPTLNPVYSSNEMHNRGYGNTFIFVEQNIEFSIFPDGQFDFYMPHYYTSSGYNACSFNSGYNYNSYVQYDAFGAIIQIEHIPVFYDFYGRVTQIGNVLIRYNQYGYLCGLGNLIVHYTAFNKYSHCSGYINAYNRAYVYRPWHRFYRIPPRNYCVIYNQPYRRNYRAARKTYRTPFKNNYRRKTAVATRRGTTVLPNYELNTTSVSPRNSTTPPLRRPVAQPRNENVNPTFSAAPRGVIPVVPRTIPNRPKLKDKSSKAKAQKHKKVRNTSFKKTRNSNTTRRR